jgi:hypothetical protein
MPCNFLASLLSKMMCKCDVNEGLKDRFFGATKEGLRENEWVNSAHFLLISPEAYR